MSVKRGKEYEAVAKDGRGRNIRRRCRAVYQWSGVATPEQTKAIDRLKKGLIEGDWGSSNDPYAVMRGVEALGVEIGEEERHPDGTWRPVVNPDVRLETMEEGAL